jgi:uncharacterized protein YndB with AHSA1/START domain
MQPYNWSAFTKRVNIRSSIREIYNCWATKAGMEKWFLRLCEYKTADSKLLADNEGVQAGTVFKWLWHGWDDNTMEKGEILETNGKDFLKFSFGQEGAEDMVCSIKIYAEQNETICELVQENIPENERGKSHYHIGCITGWTFYMANMKSVLEGGIDLRNKNVHLKNVLNS